MDDKHVHDQPSNVEAEGSAVHLHGPSDVEIVLTPKAALETAKRLGDAAVDALLEQNGTAPEPPDPERPEA